MKHRGLRRFCATAAVATVGIVGVVGGDLALAAPGGVSNWVSGGGTTGNARFTTGCCSIRVTLYCNASPGTQRFGPWRGLGVTSSYTCGPQGLFGLNWQGAG
jgi:hypothetical protein